MKINYYDLSLFVRENKTNDKCFCARVGYIFDKMYGTSSLAHARDLFNGGESLDMKTMRQIWVEQFPNLFDANKLKKCMNVKGDCGMVPWTDNLLVEF